MGGISNSFASNPELSQGLSKLYGQLRSEAEKNGGKIRGGFEKGFTSADGLVTVTLSTESMAAYKGDSKDIGIHLNVLTRSTKGSDAATSQSGGLSAPIHTIDDIAAHEAAMKQDMGPTETLDRNSKELQPLPQPSETLEEKFARLAGDLGAKPQQAASHVSGSDARLDRMKAQSEEGMRLADRLRKSHEDVDPHHAGAVTSLVRQISGEAAASIQYKPVDVKV